MSGRARRDDGIKQGTAKNIPKNKLKAFSIGQMNVTNKLSKRAEEAMKKQEQEAEAAKLLEDFVADFSTGKSHKGKAFVRGNTINPETKGIFITTLLMNYAVHVNYSSYIELA
ncbi:U2 snRNP-associated SURP motif-containing protein [Holothuria leucospilota]|uniref:U2 snRNP-associated SURP motif-containing protein n=1 Tax=Holothuria leucospilota TaxID=206669 RepID=A0A9Q1HHP9_HOLLE|nr:U2 snRNP-associated SURP motif-containing protein [Holothuria leucospilota]